MSLVTMNSGGKTPTIFVDPTHVEYELTNRASEYPLMIFRLDLNPADCISNLHSVMTKDGVREESEPILISTMSVPKYQEVFTSIKRLAISKLCFNLNTNTITSAMDRGTDFDDSFREDSDFINYHVFKGSIYKYSRSVSVEMVVTPFVYGDNETYYSIEYMASKYKIVNQSPPSIFSEWEYSPSWRYDAI